MLNDKEMKCLVDHIVQMDDIAFVKTIQEMGISREKGFEWFKAFNKNRLLVNYISLISNCSDLLDEFKNKKSS